MMIIPVRRSEKEKIWRESVARKMFTKYFKSIFLPFMNKTFKICKTRFSILYNKYFTAPSLLPIRHKKNRRKENNNCLKFTYI